jgi:hypothetical protein
MGFGNALGMDLNRLTLPSSLASTSFASWSTFYLRKNRYEISTVFKAFLKANVVYLSIDSMSRTESSTRSNPLLTRGRGFPIPAIAVDR